MDESSNIYASDAGWHDVGNIELKLWNLSRIEQPELIYGNDKHQVLLIAKIKLVDIDGEPLPDQYCPSPSEVKKLSRPVNYDDGYPLGTGISVGWNYSEQNAFLNPIQNSNDPVKNIDAQDDYISQSCAYLHFYIQTEQSNSLVSIGLCVEFQDEDGFLIKKIESSAHGKFHSSVEFRSIPEIAFRSDDFQWIGIQKFHGGDGNDSLKAGRPSDDNLWREYAYRVTLKNTKYTDHSNKIYRGVLVDYSIYRNSYSFGVINNGFYAFSGYLWPNNLFDEHNVELSNASPLVNGDYNEYIMRIEGAPERKTIIHNSEGALFLSLLCAFGASFKFGYTKMPLFVGIYDQYGNYGTICVDPDLLPDRYISSSEQHGLQSLIFFSDMMDKRPTYEQNEYYVYIRNASQKYPRNACLINLIGILEMLAPENQSASTTELNCLFKIISNKESETDVVSIYLETFNKPELKLYINCLGLLCLSSVIPGSKLQISPQWSNCSTCIADENYITYLAFTSDEHGLHVYQIQMLDNLYIDPSDWPQPPPYTLGFAGFEWLFLPDKSLVI